MVRTTEQNSDKHELKLAYEKAVMDYKRAIMYHTGTKLWHNNRSAFREHKKYYSNQVRKLFSMSIVDFNTRMRKYGALLSHLPPTSLKKDTRSFDADWDEVKITKREIRAAIYDALPEDYKTHINCQCEAGWQDMDENDFLNAMLADQYHDNDLCWKDRCRQK